MKMNGLKAGFAAVMMMFSLNVSAGWEVADVVEIQVQESGTNEYVYTTNFANPDGCAEANTLVIKTNTSFWSSMHATLLTGVIAGKTIKVETDGCGTNGYVLIRAVSVVN